MFKRLILALTLFSLGCQTAQPKAKLVIETPADLSRTTYKLEVQF